MPRHEELVVADGPLGYYRRAVDSTVPDDSGNGRDATILGDVSIVYGPVDRAFTGFHSSAVSGGSEASIQIPDSVELDASQSCTIEMFYRIASGQPDNSAFSIGSDPLVRCQAHMMYEDEVIFDYGLYTDRGRVVTAFPVEDYSQWTHVCLVADGAAGELAIWLDGVKVSSHAWTPRIATLVGGRIGDWPGGTLAATSGEIAEFAVYDYALADSRIVAHSSPGGVVDTDMLEPASIAGGAAVGSPTLTARPAVHPAGIASAAAAGSPTVTNVFPSDRIAPRGMGPLGVFGVARLIGGVKRIGPAAVVSGVEFGDIGVLSFGTRAVYPAAIGPTLTLGIADAALSGPTTLLIAGIPSPTTFGRTIVLEDEAPHARPRNRLINWSTGEVYPWPVNHATEDSIKTLGRRLNRGGMSASGFLIRQPTHPGPVHLVLHGSMIDRSQDQYRTFVRFFDACDDVVFQYIDAAGDSYTVVLTQFDARRKLSAGRLDGSYFEYTLEVEVLLAASGALKGYAL